LVPLRAVTGGYHFPRMLCYVTHSLHHSAALQQLQIPLQNQLLRPPCPPRPHEAPPRLPPPQLQRAAMPSRAGGSLQLHRRSPAVTRARAAAAAAAARSISLLREVRRAGQKAVRRTCRIRRPRLCRAPPPRLRVLRIVRRRKLRRSWRGWRRSYGSGKEIWRRPHSRRIWRPRALARAWLTGPAAVPSIMTPRKPSFEPRAVTMSGTMRQICRICPPPPTLLRPRHSGLSPRPSLTTSIPFLSSGLEASGGVSEAGFALSVPPTCTPTRAHILCSYSREVYDIKTVEEEGREEEESLQSSQG